MATKAFDPSKFRNSLTKSIKGMSAGFNDPQDWISTGNFALNYLLSGDFRRGIPLGNCASEDRTAGLCSIIFSTFCRGCAKKRKSICAEF